MAATDHVKDTEPVRLALTASEIVMLWAMCGGNKQAFSELFHVVAQYPGAVRIPSVITQRDVEEMTKRAAERRAAEKNKMENMQSGGEWTTTMEKR